jgi:hypothetical protein
MRRICDGAVHQIGAPPLAREPVLLPHITGHGRDVCGVRGTSKLNHIVGKTSPAVGWLRAALLPPAWVPTNETKEHEVRSNMRRYRLLMAGMSAAFATAAVIALPAFATNEYFPSSGYCHCYVDNAPENWIKNVWGINHAGYGNCTTSWQKTSEGYNRIEEACVGGGETAGLCHAAGQFYGHGEVKDETNNPELRGRQDNFANCE